MLIPDNWYGRVVVICGEQLTCYRCVLVEDVALLSMILQCLDGLAAA